MIQDTTRTQDSPVFLEKADLPFVQSQVLTKSEDTARIDLKKQFIENQIKTKIVEQSKKKTNTEAKESTTVKVDSSLLNTELGGSGGVFRFGDIVRPVKKTTRSTKPVLTTTYKSFFDKHELSVMNSQALTINRDTTVWMFFLLLLMVAGFAWIRVFYSKTIRQLFQAILNMTTTNQMLRDENMLLQRASVLLTVLFNLVGALFLYQTSIAFEWSSDYIGTGFARFLIFAFLVSLIYSFKFILIRISGYIFQTDKPIAGYIFNIFLINNVLGVLLLPLVIGIAFLPAPCTPWLILGSFILVGLGFLFRIFRGLLIGFSFAEFSKFHLLLYLCTLEIAPLLVIVKLFVL